MYLEPYGFQARRTGCSTTIAEKRQVQMEPSAYQAVSWSLKVLSQLIVRPYKEFLKGYIMSVSWFVEAYLPAKPI